MKFGYVPFVVLGPMFMALERGYFAEQGIDLEMVVFDSGAQMVAPAAAGQLDAITGILGFLFAIPLRPWLIAALAALHVPFPDVRGGTVSLGVRNGRLTVRDDGPGISADALPHLFDRFYRARAARDDGGSGLGLAIVKEIVVQHGGRVWAEPGGGATFIVELPG